MNLTKKGKNKWELKAQLQSGEVKFRANNNWENNWRGNDFPNGSLVINDPNIKVDSGQYNIVFDLDEMTYQFLKLE